MTFIFLFCFLGFIDTVSYSHKIVQSSSANMLDRKKFFFEFSILHQYLHKVQSLHNIQSIINNIEHFSRFNNSHLFTSEWFRELLNFFRWINSIQCSMRGQRNLGKSLPNSRKMSVADDAVKLTFKVVYVWGYDNNLDKFMFCVLWMLH